jgi:hypothetical protein
VHEHLAGGIQDADVHRFYVEIDAAIVTMLTVVSVALLLRWSRICPASAYGYSVGAQGEG